jgi:hypothetical protein
MPRPIRRQHKNVCSIYSLEQLRPVKLASHIGLRLLLGHLHRKGLSTEIGAKAETLSSARWRETAQNIAQRITQNNFPSHSDTLFFVSSGITRHNAEHF